MGNLLATWEDEETSRQIQFAVEYAITDGTVKISRVTPGKVSFVCPETNTCLRSIGVHTTAGRELLAERIWQSGRISELVAEIAQRHNLTVAV